MEIFGKGSDTMGRRYPMGNGNTVEAGGLFRKLRGLVVIPGFQSSTI